MTGDKRKQGRETEGDRGRQGISADHPARWNVTYKGGWGEGGGRLGDCGKTGMDREGVEREGDRRGGCGERRVVERDRGSARERECGKGGCVCGGGGGGVSSLSVTLYIVFTGGGGVSHICQSLFPSFFPGGGGGGGVVEVSSLSSFFFLSSTSCRDSNFFLDFRLLLSALKCSCFVLSL